MANVPLHNRCSHCSLPEMFRVFLIGMGTVVCTDNLYLQRTVQSPLSHVPFRFMILISNILLDMRELKIVKIVKIMCESLATRIYLNVNVGVGHIFSRTSCEKLPSLSNLPLSMLISLCAS